MKGVGRQTTTACPHGICSAEGLEAVDVCPSFGDANRQLLHAGLSDKVFCVALGQWDLVRCAECGSGCLDPRPTRETMAMAYRHCYRHKLGVGKSPPTGMARLRRAIANNYRNAVQGTRLVCCHQTNVK